MQDAYQVFKRQLPDSTCPFCDIEQSVVRDCTYFSVIKNMFPYVSFDNQTVVEHLLIIPKRHTLRLADFTPDEAAEYLSLITAYDTNEYNTYTRTATNHDRSVAHYHTHLMKLQ